MPKRIARKFSNCAAAYGASELADVERLLDYLVSIESRHDAEAAVDALDAVRGANALARKVASEKAAIDSNIDRSTAKEIEDRIGAIDRLTSISDARAVAARALAAPVLAANVDHFDAASGNGAVDKAVTDAWDRVFATAQAWRPWTPLVSAMKAHAATIALCVALATFVIVGLVAEDRGVVEDSYGASRAFLERFATRFLAFAAVVGLPTIGASLSGFLMGGRVRFVMAALLVVVSGALLVESCSRERVTFVCTAALPSGIATRLDDIERPICGRAIWVAPEVEVALVRGGNLPLADWPERVDELPRDELGRTTINVPTAWQGRAEKRDGTSNSCPRWTVTLAPFDSRWRTVSLSTVPDDLASDMSRLTLRARGSCRIAYEDRVASGAGTIPANCVAAGELVVDIEVCRADGRFSRRPFHLYYRTNPPESEDDEPIEVRFPSE